MSGAEQSGRVLIAESHLQESGGARVVQEVARRLPGEGISTHLFVLQRPEPGRPHLTPDVSVPVTYGSRRTSRLRSVLLPGLLRLTRLSRSADVVLAGSEVGYGLLLGFLAARLTRRPFAVLVQSNVPRALADWVPGRLQPLTRWVLTHADLAMCVSEGLVPDLLAAGIPAERVVVVPVGVDVDRVLAAADPQAQLVLPPPFFMAAGRLGPQKGFDVLIRAYAAAGEQVREFPLLIVGEGPDRADLEQLVTSLGVAGSVHLPGFLTDIQSHLARADLFVLSSRYEGMGGLVLLEAMAHGVPVIATDCTSGPRELLEGGRLGHLVPVGDEEALASALAAHVADPDRLRDQARGGPARARQFSPERWVGDVAARLRRIGHRGRRAEN